MYVIYTIYICCCCAVRSAPAWLSQVVTYGTLLNVCRGHWEVALQLLRDMHRQKIVPWTWGDWIEAPWRNLQYLTMSTRVRHASHIMTISLGLLERNPHTHPQTMVLSRWHRSSGLMTAFCTAPSSTWRTWHVHLQSSVWRACYWLTLGNGEKMAKSESGPILSTQECLPPKMVKRVWGLQVKVSRWHDMVTHILQKWTTLAVLNGH